jgi:hypothetical protein
MRRGRVCEIDGYENTGGDICYGGLGHAPSPLKICSTARHRGSSPCSRISDRPFPPIRRLMSWMVTSGAHAAQRGHSAESAAGAYVLIVRGTDGRPRCERFNDAAAYRARLVALQYSNRDGFSIEEIADLLDT